MSLEQVCMGQVKLPDGTIVRVRVSANLADIILRMGTTAAQAKGKKSRALRGALVVEVVR